MRSEISFWSNTLIVNGELQGTLSPASDIFALGVLLWEMVSQQRAWAGLSLSRIRAMVTGCASRTFPSDLPLQIQVHSAGKIEAARPACPMHMTSSVSCPLSDRKHRPEQLAEPQQSSSGCALH